MAIVGGEVNKILGLVSELNALDAARAARWAELQALLGLPAEQADEELPLIELGLDIAWPYGVDPTEDHRIQSDLPT